MSGSQSSRKRSPWRGAPARQAPAALPDGRLPLRQAPISAACGSRHAGRTVRASFFMEPAPFSPLPYSFEDDSY